LLFQYINALISSFRLILAWRGGHRAMNRRLLAATRRSPATGVQPAVVPHCLVTLHILMLKLAGPGAQKIELTGGRSRQGYQGGGCLAGKGGWFSFLRMLAIGLTLLLVSRKASDMVCHMFLLGLAIQTSLSALLDLEKLLLASVQNAEHSDAKTGKGSPVCRPLSGQYSGDC